MYQQLPAQVLEQAAPLGRAVAHDGAAPTPEATMQEAFSYLFERMEHETWTRQVKRQPYLVKKKKQARKKKKTKMRKKEMTSQRKEEKVADERGI